MDNAGMENGHARRHRGRPYSDPLKIRLLGQFEVSLGDRQIDPDAWRLRKATHLVKLLALTPGHRMHRDQLIDALWPEVDPDSALSSFHQALHAARRALEPDRAARSTQSMLRLQRQVLSLECDDGLWIDIEAFQDAVQGIRSTSDLQRCLDALDLYAGDLLPEDLYESWTQNPRDSLREMYLELLLTTSRLQEASGEASEAIETLRTLIATDPLNEAAYAALMQILATSGRRDQAIRLYQQLSDTLRDELDAEPTDEVTALFQRINAGDVIATPVSTRLLPPSKPSAPTDRAGGRRLTLTDVAKQDGLFDRLDEVAALQRAFDSLMEGQGQIVLLGGEPGIGKTRLAEELAHFATMIGATVLWARCHEAEGSPSFWPWFQIVRQSLRGSYYSAEELREDLGAGAAPIAQVVPHIRALLPDLPESPELDSNQARFRFFDSLSSFLGRLSERVPLLLILDDLHWADNSSLTMLEFLTDEIAAHRIMLLGTYREAEAGISLHVIRTLERINRSSAARRLHVSGFKLVDVAQYGAFIAGRPLPENLVQTIYQRTNGNPFFMREVVQLLAREEETEDPRQWETVVPVGVREAITLRLAQLSDDARQVLTAAAVIGGEFAFDILAGVAGTSEDNLLRLLEEAVTLGVITEEKDAPNRFRFTHILTQQTLYDGLIAARRARMHARVASVLEELYATSVDPPYSELAHHFFVAASTGEAERAVKYLRLAGKQSMSRLSYSEAVDQFRRATEVIERYLPGRQAELFDVLIDIARAQLASGASSEARSSRLRSVDVARDLGDPERLALAALEMVNVGSDYLDWRAAEEIGLLEEALAQLPPGNDALRVQVMSALALTLVFDKSEAESADREIRRKRMADDAVSVARHIGTPALLSEALLAARDVLWTYEDVDQRRVISRELLDIALETHDPRLEMSRARAASGRIPHQG